MDIDPSNIFKVPSVDWGKLDDYIMHEGFYFYGGKGDEDFISDDMYLLKPVEKFSNEKNCIFDISIDFPSNPLMWMKL